MDLSMSRMTRRMLSTFLWSSSAEPASSRQLNDDRGSSDFDEEGDDPYEFVAFLLWYVFLVLCCIVPTCCAYRRRRLIERRIVEQQANMAQFQQTNLFFLNANNRQNAISEEALQQERHRLLTETLKSTTMTISEGDLKTVEGSSTYLPPISGPVISMHGSNTPPLKRDDADPEIALEATNDTSATTKAIDEEQGENEGEDNDISLDMELESNMVLLLPEIARVSTTVTTTTDTDKESKKDAPNSNGQEQPMASQQQPEQGSTISCTGNRRCREVAGSCAICLSPYEVGDQVTWSSPSAPTDFLGADSATADQELSSSTNYCPHAFHTECIIGWLSKKEHPKCPVCRRPFCETVLVVPSTNNSTSIPLGGPNNNGGGPPAADDIPFPFSRSLAETVALARLSILASEQEQQQQQALSQSTGNAQSATAPSSTTVSTSPEGNENSAVTTATSNVSSTSESANRPRDPPATELTTPAVTE